MGVIRGEGLESFRSHGVANIESATPVTEDTVFRIGSITKTFTAVALMQLWEQGLIDLDTPANDYLRAFRLVPAEAGWRPATVRHLLTHTAGVPEWLHPSRMINSGWFAESFSLEEPVPTLAEYYRGGLPLAAEPGTIWTYSDHGVATVGQIVEDVTDSLCISISANASSSRLGWPIQICCDRTACVAACHWLSAEFSRRKGGDGPPRSDCGGGVDLLHPSGHGALCRHAARRWFR